MGMIESVMSWLSGDAPEPIPTGRIDPEHINWSRTDAGYWKRLREQAEADYAAGKAEHDRTGQHTWLDQTAFGDSGSNYICTYCPATKTVEREDVDDA